MSLVSANAEFIHWQVSVDFEKMPSGSPHLRGREKCNIAKSCLCKPKAESDLWTRLYKTAAFSMKHHCFLVRSSPASSRFYEHALTNSFQSFPAFPLQCPSDEGNFLPGDVWLDTRLDVVAMTAAPGLAYPYPASPLQTQLFHILYSLGNQNMLLFLVF